MMGWNNPKVSLMIGFLIMLALWAFVLMLVMVPASALAAILTGDWRYLIITALCLFLIRRG